MIKEIDFRILYMLIDFFCGIIFACEYLDMEI